jgi:hypothetical protein
VSEELFWLGYRKAEKGVFISREEFLSSSKLVSEVIEGLKMMISQLLITLKEFTGKQRMEEIITELILKKAMPPSQIDEMVEAIKLSDEIIKGEKGAEELYENLVRIMETIEASYKKLTREMLKN